MAEVRAAAAASPPCRYRSGKGNSGQSLGGTVLAPARRMSRRYQPRRPADTVLYRLVSEQLETFLRHADAEYQQGLPRYVEQELRQYLKCGIFYALVVMMRGVRRSRVDLEHCEARGSALSIYLVEGARCSGTQ